MAKVVVMDHPLIQHKIGYIRRTDTGTKDFRETIAEIANLICYEATRDLKLKDVEIETPICKTTVKELAGKKLAVVPILRAGLGMVDGVLQLVPAAKVGHIGLYRDPETLEPVEYYCKLPADCAQREVFVVDPDVYKRQVRVDVESLQDEAKKSQSLQILKEAGEIIKNGGLVAFPTETVYGLGGDALNPESSRKIYAAKGRPSDNPLIVHIADMEHLERITESIPEAAYTLAQHFWPCLLYTSRCV